MRLAGNSFIRSLGETGSQSSRGEVGMPVQATQEAQCPIYSLTVVITIVQCLPK